MIARTLSTAIIAAMATVAAAQTSGTSGTGTSGTTGAPMPGMQRGTPETGSAGAGQRTTTPTPPMNDRGTDTMDRTAPGMSTSQPGTGATPPAGSTPGGTGMGSNTGMTGNGMAGGTSQAETRLRTRLTRQGYSDVQDLTQDGSRWQGSGMYRGKRYDLTIAPDGSVRRRPAR